MKRIVTWLFSTITVMVFVLGYHTSTSGSPTADSDIVVSSTPRPGLNSSGSDSSGSGRSGEVGGSDSGDSESSTTSPSTTTVTGPVVDTKRGPVQVQVTTEGQEIIEVSVLQHPDDGKKSDEINAKALPILIEDTLDAQSADIDMISGATLTSEGYSESLQAALDEARP